MINNQLKTLRDAVIDYETCSIDYQPPPPAPPPKHLLLTKKKKSFDVFIETDEVYGCNPFLAIF